MTISKQYLKIIKKINRGASWQFCRFGEWIIGDGLCPFYCLKKIDNIRLSKNNQPLTR